MKFFIAVASVFFIVAFLMNSCGESSKEEVSYGDNKVVQHPFVKSETEKENAKDLWTWIDYGPRDTDKLLLWGKGTNSPGSSDDTRNYLNDQRVGPKTFVTYKNPSRSRIKILSSNGFAVKTSENFFAEKQKSNMKNHNPTDLGRVAEVTIAIPYPETRLIVWVED